MAKKLLISAAHTKENPGAIYQGLREADLTRKMLSLIIPILEKQKVDFEAVPLDLPLRQRIKWINERNLSEVDGDIFVELHVNDGGKRGLESWFRGKSSENNRSEQLAQYIVENVSKQTGYHNNGAKSEFEHEFKSLLILNQINIPGTVLELLFIDNQEDREILEDEFKLKKLLESVASAIKDFLETVPIVLTQDNNNQIYDENDIEDDDDSDEILPFSSFLPPIETVSDSNIKPKPSSGNEASSTNHSITKTSHILMDRDQRKEMILETYKKILGKEPNQNDLNYYLNIAITEEDLVKKLLASDDFKKLKSDAYETEELKKEKQKNEIEYQNCQKKLEDLEKMVENLNNLLNVKNQYILQMQEQLKNHQIIKHGEYFDKNRIKKNEKLASLKRRRKKDLIDKIIKTLGI